MSCSWLFYWYLSSVCSADSYYSPHAGEGFSKTDLGMDSESSLNGLEDVLINHQNRGDTESTASGAGGGSLHHHLNSSHAPPGDASSSSSSTHHHHPHVTPSSIFGSSMTPIDKLYSMQSSYFSSSDCECLGAASNWEVIQVTESNTTSGTTGDISPLLLHLLLSHNHKETSCLIPSSVCHTVT